MAPDPVRELAIAGGPGDAPLLVCAGREESVTLIDPAGRVQARNLGTPGSRWFLDMKASGVGGRRIVAWSEPRAVHVLDLDRPDEPLRIDCPRRQVFGSVSVADVDGQAVVVTVVEGERARRPLEPKTLLWDAGTGRVIGELPAGPGGKGEIAAVAITSSAAGEPLLVSGGRDGQVRVWDLPDIRLRQAFLCPGARPGTAAAAPMVGGGPAGDLTVVATVWNDWLFCWRLETGELLQSTHLNEYLGWYDSRELVVGRVGARTVVAGLARGGPVAFEADSGARVPLLVHDRGSGPTGAALRATPSGIVHAVAFTRRVRCHLLQEAPDDATETGVDTVAAGTWDGRPAVLSGDIDGRLWVRDLRTGELLERRDRTGRGRLSAVAGRIVGNSGDRPVDLLTGKDAGPPLQVGWGSLDRAWWGSPDGEDQVAFGVLSKNNGGSDSYTAVRIGVWDSTTGQLRSLRDAPTDSELTLAIGTVGGEPALVSSDGGRDLTVESLATGPVRGRSRRGLPRWRVSRGSGPTGDALVMLGDGYLAYGRDEIVRVVGCVRADGETRLEDVAQIDVGTRVNALAYAGEGQLVIGCNAGVQLVEIAIGTDRAHLDR
jgi:WD40 repeat protein